MVKLEAVSIRENIIIPFEVLTCINVFIPPNILHEAGEVINIPFLQMRKLRHKELS